MISGSISSIGDFDSTDWNGSKLCDIDDFEYVYDGEDIDVRRVLLSSINGFRGIVLDFNDMDGGDGEEDVLRQLLRREDLAKRDPRFLDSG